ncbi:hypothetical protein psal_cds_38 [Pandoravirus salinus]|uniref:Uncharacterized protein n=1 Tax=Pandoravirus salinus TaxID=1349410 RepID=S4VZF5_9VIRU|nr:hypothetical protein psal_cds_38 [Pandoravirus salinus]AGO83417.1 hypothetical protein psal_cds_38 [Pandoravirus salinus]
MESMMATLATATTTAAVRLQHAVRSMAAMVTPSAALCGVVAATMACLRTQRSVDGDNVVMRGLNLGFHATLRCATAAYLYRQRPTSLVAYAVASIAAEEAAFGLLAHGPAGVVHCALPALARAAVTLSVSAVVWSVWNLCIATPAASLISPSLDALYARPGTIVWVVMVAASVRRVVSLYRHGLPATPS